jgi:CTP synthase
MGGTMRLGLYPCILQKDSIAAKAYNKDQVNERHRHRFEFNNTYREEFEKNGMVFSGVSPDNMLVEVSELKDHPFMVSSQFHPEFLSRPMRPHPLFVGLIKAAKEKSK